MANKILVFNKNHFVSQLEDMGHSVLVAGVPEEQSLTRPDSWSQYRIDFLYSTGDSLEKILKLLPNNFCPDRIIYHDDSYPCLRVTGWEKCSVPSLFYSVDAHIHVNWHSILGGMFDEVLVAQKDFIPSYLKFNERSAWFPLWAPKILTPSSNKSTEVCFRGNLNAEQRPQRVSFLKAISENIPLDYKSGPYEEAFTQSKIILNEAIHDDVNYRVFESLSSGGLLITPKTSNGLLDMFNDGEDLITYEKHSVTDALDKIKYYLENETRRATIAENGRAKVLALHTEAVRGNQFLHIVENLSLSSRPYIYYSSAYQLLFAYKLSPQNPELLITAALLLKESLKKKELCDENLVFMVLKCAAELEDQDLALSLAFSAAKEFSSELSLRLIAIYICKKFSKDTEAIELAKTLGENPSEIINLANNAVATLLSANG